jgi:hypothetical protein
MDFYIEKNRKYEELRAGVQISRPGYRVEQVTICVSPTGAILKESMEEFAKVSRLPSHKLASHCRSMVDACIQGAMSNTHSLAIN